MIFRYLLILCTLAGCSGLERSEREKIRRQNAQVERVHRHCTDRLYRLPVPRQHLREKYPWEETYAGRHPRITKEFLRCRGSSFNPERVDLRAGQSIRYTDCAGGQSHPLPMRSGNEYIPPVLLDILNHIQQQLGQRVIITCGHRCPKHSAYANPAAAHHSVKHQSGTAVDFYVQGMEQQPEEVIKQIFHFYRSHPREQEQNAYVQFTRGSRQSGLSVAPWVNRDITIRLFKKNEGRDFDNRHPYPYICLEVREGA